MSEELQVRKKLDALVKAFQSVLYEEDETFMKNMETKCLAKDDVRKYMFWEWPQGVGLFGLWKYFDYTKEQKYLDMLVKFYTQRIQEGLPAKNINTVAPLLGLSYFYEYTKEEKYGEVCEEWAQWLMHEAPRTKERGLQHLTSDTLNDQELWDDTLFMAVLFLGNFGRISGRQEYIDEAEYQFLVHAKYLADKKTGLWFHGYTFNGNHNFAEAFWGRGNCWITAAIPEFLEITEHPASIKNFLAETLKRQAESLAMMQDKSGMWHTLIDDPSSYLEASATCGIAYGLLIGSQMGILAQECKNAALKAVHPILDCITDDGIVNQVSYGTPMGRGSKDFYKHIEIKSMPYGQALAILFLMEILKIYNK